MVYEYSLLDEDSSWVNDSVTDIDSPCYILVWMRKKSSRLQKYHYLKIWVILLFRVEKT